MRPARIIAAVVVAAAVAATGSYLALSTASHPSATASPVGSAPTTTRPSGDGSERMHSTATTGPSSGQLTPGRCAASALRGSVQDSDGAAGHIWYRIRLGNASTRTCTLRGIPGVRLLAADGQPVTAPSVPGGPAGSLVLLRPGRAARFSFI